MRSAKLLRKLAFLALPAAILAAGCETTDHSHPRGEDYTTEYGDNWFYPESEAPERPAPKPAPKKVVVTQCGTSYSDGDWNWSAMAYPTGNASTSTLCAEIGMPTSVRRGSDFCYMIKVTNLTDVTLHQVIVNDEFDSNFSFASATPNGVATGNGRAWDIGELGPHESRTIEVCGSATSGDLVGNCLVVSHVPQLCASTPIVEPALELVKTGPAEVLKCEPIVYNFVVTNPGNATVRGVKINDPLPNGLTTDGGNRSITYDVGDLGAGESKSFSASVMANSTGTFENAATAMGDGLSASSGTVRTVVREPMLEVAITCEDREFIGRPIDYEYSVCNRGDGPAHNTVLTGSLPAGATVVRADGSAGTASGSGTWNIGTLAPGDCRTFTVRYMPGTDGSYTSTVTASADCAATVSDSCTTEVVGIPAILLEVVDLDDPIEVGNNETYVIRVTNQGSAPDTNIVIRAFADDSQSFVSAGGATNASNRGREITFAPYASLAPGAMIEFRVVVRADQVDDARFRVAMTSDQLRREPVEETEATNQYE